METEKSFLWVIFVNILCMLATHVSAQDRRIVCDETCKTESAAIPVQEGKAAGFSVVSPVPRGTVPMITQAPRLNSLSGKTIAVVGVSFMSKINHPERDRLACGCECCYGWL